MKEFVHLHVHTEYSLLDSTIKINGLLEKAKKYGMESVAITDHMAMHGAIKFYNKANEKGIKPVIGCECHVAPCSLCNKTHLDINGVFHLVLLVKDREGYSNLCKIVSIAHLKGNNFKPYISMEVLRKYSKGLIALSACLNGEIPFLILKGRLKQADKTALLYLNIFGEDNFYLEVQNNGIEKQEEVNKVLFDMSKRLSIPLVATNNCHYLDQEDARAYNALSCIKTGSTINNKRIKYKTDQLYFNSKDEMYNIFRNRPDILEQSFDIAKKCNVEFDFNTCSLPNMAAGSGKTDDDLFEQKVKKGFNSVMQHIRKTNHEIDESLYIKRLEHEISVIKERNYCSYFLIVDDYVRYAKEINIPVGPGRGSAPGSLAAYSLGITDFDPIQHGLIFERFIGPSNFLPDIQVDFCMKGRKKVLNYLFDKYGADHAAYITVFEKFRGKRLILEVGRILEIPLQEVENIVDMIADHCFYLKNTIDFNPGLKKLIEDNSEISELINICLLIEGLPQYASIHAAGISISGRPLIEYTPLYKDKNGNTLTQIDSSSIEKLGLGMFNLLGLRDLTVIADTLSLIDKRNGTPPDLSSLDIDDPDTFRLISSGNTAGVFNLGSLGMKDLLIRFKPDCFTDLITLASLYRPGPLESGMTDDLIQRKLNNFSVEYTIPELEPILKETYGIIIYQEQIMEIACELANYTMNEANDLRRAMGMKIASVISKHKERFFQGATANGISAAKTNKIFDEMIEKAGFAFNKSHSIAYGLIAYRMAYLKTHFPDEFNEALLLSNNSGVSI